MQKLKKNDEVVILAGKDKDKKGKVQKVIKDGTTVTKVVVEGLNIFKKHVKPTQEKPKGAIVELERAFDSSNVQLVCPSCKKPAKVEIKVLKDGIKQRACKKCGEIIDK